MPKSKDAFRTISEVAEWLDVPAHVLRFWESKFTQVKPVKRAGGRRYYRPADMRLLGGIKRLLHDDGLTIKGAQKLLREHGVKHVAELSQPLDEDLIEEAPFEEAALEDAQLSDAVTDEAATVLSFPQRGGAPADPAVENIAAAPVEEPTQVEQSEADVEAPTEAPEQSDDLSPELETSASAPAPDAGPAPEPAPQKDAPVENTPVLGENEALPAFMRRAPLPEAPSAASMAPAEPERPAEPQQDVAQSETGTTEDQTGDDRQQKDASSGSEKVTISPIARFQFVRSKSLDELPEQVAPTPESAPQDAAPETPAPQHAAPTENQDTAAALPKVQAPQSPVVDIPSLAKVAPELASFTAAPGVLSKLAHLDRLSPEIANDISTQLAELRALSARMQSH